MSSPSGVLENTAQATVANLLFDEEMAKLNPQQRLAVETIEGPVMIVAGPGTGKTQVVALRVANILKKTQMRPGNILCLTFSTSGAAAMRDRLRMLIGPDAYGVAVNTIHGFCNEIILQNPQVFEAWSALEQISDVEQLRAVNKILDQLLPDLVLVNRKNPYQRSKEILDRISQVKREGKTLVDLEAAAVLYDKQMADKSKPGTKVHEKNLLAARKFREFIKVFGMYQEMLAQTQRYDYDDMILTVIKALREEDWLLSTLQERFHYVIVDEFQDTNGAQCEMLTRLTTYASGDEPNFCVVGDDDQAIYRFQGANLQNILSFRERFPGAAVIALTTSYRCSQPILDAAGALIKRNTERLVGKVEGLTKDLHSATGPGPHVRLVRTASDVTEPWAVAELVEQALARGVSPDAIAILTQKNKELPLYYEVLKAKDVPAQLTGKLDLLAHPLVKQAITILKAIERPMTDGLLADALACECFGCHPADLGRLFAQRREQEQSLYHLLLSSDAWSDALLKARNTLLSLHQRIGSRTLVQTLECVLKECGLLPVPTPEGKLTIDLVDFAALQAFFDRMRLRAYEQTNFSFEMLLSDLALYGEDFGELKMQYALPHLVENGVQLMTAHHSKGLEFEVVILPRFCEGHWDKKRAPSSLSLPEDLLFGWQKETKDFEKIQDERRVAYVAMTRAKRELILTCPHQSASGDKARDMVPSAFFAEAEIQAEEEHELQDSLRISTLLLAPPRHLDTEFKAFLKERIENFALSPTSLNHFLGDPQQFLLRDMLQIPEVKNTSFVYGNAVHAALRRWALAMKEGLPLNREQFLGEFENYLVDREILTESERRNLLVHGRENLERYYDASLAIASPFVQKIEFPIHAYSGDIPLKGKIDRIDTDHPDSATATVIDFKTGKPHSEAEIRGGDYYRQLTFYALLLAETRSPFHPKAFVLDFIGEGTDGPVERSFAIPQQDIEDLKKLIANVWGKIVALDFTPL